MKRTEAEELFGGKPGLAEAIGVKLPSVYEWPDELSIRLQDRVFAALLRADRVSEALALLTKERRRLAREAK